MLLYQEALVLGRQIHAPVNRELEFTPVGHGLFQNLDTFRIRETNERVLQHTLQASDQLLIKHIIQELHVVHAILQRPTYAIFDELLGQLHIIRNIVERDLRLNHPELRQMTRRIGILGTERRTERIDLSQGRRRQLALQLSGNRQAGLLPEEIIVIQNRTLLILLQIIQVQRRHLEHLSGTLAIGSRNDWCMEIEETPIVEELMYRVRHVMTDTEHGAKGIRTGTQMSDLAQELHRMPFLLQRIHRGIGRTIHLNLGGLNLHALPFSLRTRQDSVYAHARARGNRLQELIAKLIHVYDNLYVMNGRSIVQRDKTYLLAATTRTHPSPHVHGRSKSVTLQYIYDFCPSNQFHVIVLYTINII